MHKVKNKKVIRRIADKTRKAQKGRNIIAVIAIALTSLLFTSLFTIGGSMARKSQESTMRQVGGSAHVGYKYLSQGEYDTLKRDKKIKEISYRIIVGDIIEDSLKKLPTEVNYFEELDAKMSFCYPQKGRLPEREDEIATSDLVLEAMGVPCKLGEKLSLKIEVGDQVTEKTFTLSGYFEGDPVAMAQMACVSKQFQEKIAPVPQKSIIETGITSSSDYVGRINADVNFASSLMLQKQVDALNRRCGFPENADVGINWAYLGGDIEVSSILMVVILLLVILVSGYLIIYNIFYINVFQDIAQYGLLKTIGTTGRQLRRIVRRQAYMLSLYGIPAGLLGGALVGKLLLPLIMSQYVYSETVDSSVVLNGWLFAGAALFSFGTVYISCIKPCRVASGVTAIEAVRYTEGQEKMRGRAGIRRSRRQKTKKTRRVTPRAMALQNVRRNRKKAFVVVASLSLALVLLNSIYSVLSGFDMDLYVSNMSISDFAVADATMDNFNTRDVNTAGVTKDFLQDLGRQAGITEWGNIYVKEIYPTFTEGDWKKIEERIFDDPAAQAKINFYGPPEETDYAGMMRQERYVDGNTYGVGKVAMEALECLDGALDWEKFQTGDYVIATRFALYDEEGEGIDFFHPGEKVTVFNEKGQKRQYEVMAVAEIPYPLGTKRFGVCDCDYILPEEEFLDFMGKQQPMRTIFNVEKEREDRIEKWLADYCETVNADLSYTSRQSVLAEFDSYKNLIVIVGNLLCLVLAFIGILNFVNTMITSVMSRKQEFAMMEAVGMTGAQLRRMLCVEGGYYAVLTGVLSLAAAAALNATAVRSVGMGYFFFAWKFTVTPVLACLPVLFLIVYLVPAACYGKLCKTSVVERMRRME